MSETVPKDFHNLRACLLCHLIKNVDQFEKNGCENCEQFLGLRHQRELVQSCTTANFSGIVSMCQPDGSWVAKWLRISRNARGLYAIDVSGKLPSRIINELRSMGVTAR